MLKLRGQAYLEGTHGFCLTDFGTTILTYETCGGVTSTQLNMIGERFSYMADSMIFLTVESAGGYKRTLSVIKQRASAHFSWR